MTNILDALKPKPQAFRPESVAQYMVLQLAKRLGDPDLVWKYRSLFDHHSLRDVLEALGKAQDRGLAGRDLTRAFEEELSAVTTKDDDDAS